MNMREKLARALERSADSFCDPVGYYVEHEARRRWEVANPDADPFATDTDWNLESWKIFADAALGAIEAAGMVIVPRVATQAMIEAGDTGSRAMGDKFFVITECYSAMIEAAAK